MQSQKVANFKREILVRLQCNLPKMVVPKVGIESQKLIDKTGEIDTTEVCNGCYVLKLSKKCEGKKKKLRYENL